VAEVIARVKVQGNAYSLIEDVEGTREWYMDRMISEVLEVM